MIEILPRWLSDMKEEDISFIKNFIINSGSLKEMSKMYNVTYPTMRLRLDRLIQKIELSDKETEDDYISLIKKMAIEERIDIDTARLLINAYRKEKGDEKT